MRKGQKGRKGLKRLACVVCVLFVFSVALPLFAEHGYTNHAGNVVTGWPVAFTATQVTLGACGGETPPPRNQAASWGGAPHLAIPSGAYGGGYVSAAPQGETYPLSIFPESEQTVDLLGTDDLKNDFEPCGDLDLFDGDFERDIPEGKSFFKAVLPENTEGVW